MKIVSAGYQIINEPDILKKIERIARVCYKSENKITDESALKMVKSLVERNHWAMLEHSSLAFDVDSHTYYTMLFTREHIEHAFGDKKHERYESKRCYLRFTNYDDVYIISGNIRAWIETFQYSLKSGMDIPKKLIINVITYSKGILETAIGIKNINKHNYFTKREDSCVKYISDWSEYSNEEKMVHHDMTVLFTTDRGISHEIVRMRECSFAMESTRYCNYSNNKFGNEITVVKPDFFEKDSNGYKIWESSMKEAENRYFELLAYGYTPEKARDVLPMSLRVDIAVTANLTEWKHIFELRACDITGAAHPSIHEIMVPLFKEMRNQYPSPSIFGAMLAYNEVSK